MCNRRNRILALVVLIVVGLAGAHAFMRLRDRYTPSPHPSDPDEALVELRNGNARFVANRRTFSIDTAHDDQCRRETALGQHPFATIVCCADSRVCPEFIFDQRPGTIFEIRNAGNVVDDDVMASIEYAVEHLHTPVIVVLGHKGCGAIRVIHEAGDKPLHAHLHSLQEHMKGIRDHVVKTQGRHDRELLDSLSRENAREQALTLLLESAPIRAAVEQKHIKLVFGMYDMETGEVEFFEL